MQPPPVRESLELVAPAEVELHLSDGADELPDHLRNQDLAAPCLAGYAGRNVDRGAEDVARFLDHLAGVDADADADLPLRVLLAVLSDRPLDVARAFDTGAARSETAHEAVAESLGP